MMPWPFGHSCPSRGRARGTVGSRTRNKKPPSPIYSAEGKFNQSTNQDTTMFTKSTIALSFAAVLSAASVPLTTAFAKSNYLERDSYALSSQNGKGERAQMNRYHGGNAIRGEHPRQPGDPLRWIDNPASPGG
jgi:hypothetical protein